VRGGVWSMTYATKVRTLKYGMWKHEWWQYDGHYIIKTWLNGVREPSIRGEGKAPGVFKVKGTICKA